LFPFLSWLDKPATVGPAPLPIHPQITPLVTRITLYFVQNGLLSLAISLCLAHGASGLCAHARIFIHSSHKILIEGPLCAGTVAEFLWMCFSMPLLLLWGPRLCFFVPKLLPLCQSGCLRFCVSLCAFLCVLVSLQGPLCFSLSLCLSLPPPHGALWIHWVSAGWGLPVARQPS
jgi:hypothetical protein